MNKEAHSHAESEFRRATHMKVRAADKLTKKQREELEAQKIAEQEQLDTDAADRWIEEHGGWGEESAVIRGGPFDGVGIESA